MNNARNSKLNRGEDSDRRLILKSGFKDVILSKAPLAKL